MLVFGIVMRNFLVALLGAFVLFAICSPVECSDSEDASLEYEIFNLEVIEGKKMKLLFRNGHRFMRNPKWYFNGRSVSKTRCTSNYGELVCPAVTRNDTGRYDLWAEDGTRQGQASLMFSANVQVVKKVEQDVGELIMPNNNVQEVESYGQHEETGINCFCSGVTNRCRMATDLYRTRHNFNLSSAIPETTLPMESETVADYLKIPSSVWSGNLITAYGGYLRFPVTDECYINRSKPCVLLFDKRYRDRAIGYFLPPTHSQRQVQVVMKESSWRLVSARNELGDREREEKVDKFVFMSTLSHIKDVYIRGRYRSRDENNMLTIDLATMYNDGLGRVSTVEECDCYPGYGGLSCEVCNKGYIRVYGSVNPDGLCITISQLWLLRKGTHSLEFAGM
uniref:Laminin IV type A domain-containing protein n=1 Tax=Anopheles minimus TaxID=112268 RepID=A0A182VT92_9DIPT